VVRCSLRSTYTLGLRCVFCGTSKIAVTMEIYTDVPDELTRDALRKLGEQVDS
jgi:hypothetical protein